MELFSRGCRNVFCCAFTNLSYCLTLSTNQTPKYKYECLIRLLNYAIIMYDYSPETLVSTSLTTGTHGTSLISYQLSLCSTQQATQSGSQPSKSLACPDCARFMASYTDTSPFLNCTNTPCLARWLEMGALISHYHRTAMSGNSSGV